MSEAGGAIYTPPTDVGDLGRMAVVADPSGAAFGISGAFSCAECARCALLYRNTAGRSCTLASRTSIPKADGRHVA